jgi:hypothetical protein
MKVTSLIEILQAMPQDADVVVDLDDGMDKNYQAVNDVSALSIEWNDSTIVVLNHKW